MGKNKLTLQFKAFEEYAERLDELGGDLKAVTERALQDSHDFINPRLHQDMKRHKRSGRTDAAITDKAKVEWEGTVASIDVGFKIRNGGLASIFLMYGTPRVKPDQQLYDDIYGRKTRREIAKLQEEIFARAIKKRMEG